MLVSVIMPVFNGIQFLHESIESILSQSHDELEFIIVDDCSTEPVWDLVKSICDTRISAIQNDKNLGLTKSLNICLDRARGDYIVRHDADDVSFAIRIEEQLKLFTEEVGFVGCWASSINEHNEMIKGFVDEHCCCNDEDLVTKYRMSLCMPDATTMYSKEAIKRTGYFDPALYLGQTYNYNLRVLNHFKGRVVPEILYLARQHKNQTGKKVRRKLRSEGKEISWSEFAKQRAADIPIIGSGIRCQWGD